MARRWPELERPPPAIGGEEDDLGIGRMPRRRGGGEMGVPKSERRGGDWRGERLRRLLGEGLRRADCSLDLLSSAAKGPGVPGDDGVLPTGAGEIGLGGATRRDLSLWGERDIHGTVMLVWCVHLHIQPMTLSLINMLLATEMLS